MSFASVVIAAFCSHKTYIPTRHVLFTVTVIHCDRNRNIQQDVNKMSKTVQIEDDVHMLIVDKQHELKKRGIKKEIRQIVNEAIKAGIDIVSEE